MINTNSSLGEILQNVVNDVINMQNSAKASNSGAYVKSSKYSSNKKQQISKVSNGLQKHMNSSNVTANNVQKSLEQDGYANVSMDEVKKISNVSVHTVDANLNHDNSKKNNLRRAIVLSEVLSEPICKKRHRRKM